MKYKQLKERIKNKAKDICCGEHHKFYIFMNVVDDVQFKTFARKKSLKF